MRSALLTIALATLLVLAGCAGGEPTETEPDTPEWNVTYTVATESPTETDEPVGTSGYETDLDVRSYEETPVDLDVRITWNETGEVIFRKNLTVRPGDRYDFDIPFPEPGNYTVRAVRNGTVYTYVWELEYTDPGYELIVEANDGQVNFGKSGA